MMNSDFENRFKTPGYESLADVLARAYDQAAAGKGAQRHACDRPFTEQPMQAISSLLGSKDGLLYQAMKKIQESQRMDKDAAIRELLGAINYIAGAVIWMEAERPPGKHLLDLISEGKITDGEAYPRARVEASSRRWVCSHPGFEPESCPQPINLPRSQHCPVCGATAL